MPVIKTEKEQFEISPLRDDCFNIDLSDDHAAIKIEPDMDIDFCINEGLDGLMGVYPFENEADVKPVIKSHEKDFSPTVTSTATTTTAVASSRNNGNQPQQQPTTVPTGIL